jgi:hypothetical protein
LYNQGDARWGNKPLGTSGVVMSSHGCYVTSTCMAINNYGYRLDPGQLCDALNANNGFDAEGQMKWDVLEKVCPNVVFADAFWTTKFVAGANLLKVQQEAALQRLEKCVRIGIPVVLCVDMPNVNWPGFPDHAVVLKHAPPGRIGWKVYDPAGGLEIELAAGQRYGTPEQAVYGARIVVGHGQTLPDYSDLRDAEDGLRAFRASQAWRGRNQATYLAELKDSYIGL